MKEYLYKRKVFFSAFILLLFVLPAGAVSVLAAAKPVMSVTSKTVIGLNQEFTLSVKNLTKSKVKSTGWSSTNKEVATVSGGNVTSVGRGTATIKCKITYKDGTVITPTCKVTVKIPATAIEITNAKDDISNNSRQVIAVGDSYDFDSVLTPANADNYITYAVSNTEYATVDKKGIVTGKKPGFVTLTAQANLNKPADYKNLLDSILVLKDSINIEIVTKTAGVTSVELTDTTTLKVTFDKAMNKSTLFNDKNKLLSNITITAKTDSNGMTASGLGTLTGSLSSDGKTLTVTPSGYFNGLYGIKFSNNILTADSEPLMEYYETLSLYDTTPPSFKDFTIDDTGLVVSINFSESMNYSGMQIQNVELVTKNTTAKTATISRLSNKANYKASGDGKSLTIDLSQMSSVDQNKQFKIVFTGLKDRAGNYPDNDRITALLATDTTPKSQARLVSLERTDYNTLTATFTRAISVPGRVLLSNGEIITGVISEDNPRQVTYTLDSESAKLSGKQEVNIGFWDSYNVKDSDNSADDYKEVKVDFTINSAQPEISGYELVVETGSDETVYNLILTFDKEVSLLDDEGILSSKLVTADGDVYNDYDIGYTADADDTVVTVILDSEDFGEPGTYTITIPEEFVEDIYGNTNDKTTVKVKNTEGSSTALPGPRLIVQSENDASIIYVTFANQVDEDTAEDLGNYEVEGAGIISAELIDNGSGGATVELTLEPGSVTKSTRYYITISGIIGYHNTYTEMEEYKTRVYLNENVGPEIEDVKYTYPDVITITFDETLAGTASFRVLQNGADLVESSRISGKKIIITLVDRPVLDEEVEIVPTSYNHITDKYGNVAEIASETIVPTR